ncbi:D-alanyl-D-alanine carboxypeptidase/D-alanyl-D-alanine-endopeptidase [Legionella quinlivanii]|uniref:D-alanyl-D-alanine carboxypeptidase/D-alanyl-D-alanine-endopeptidase n=1 Tax=Legionella quinlivanii TaxID=45073 RepID=A0A364LIU9_9GAMM|nr:D-alanyl-D-alanine carboxypeptidase/D-alanyl-D-alanine-endopeptidase [Legionella quinlivanii]RAP36186.1 D-alanyl-D-alanine carboxypeptidase/D-alanyl-D-alanine-endopeptidase [Legionella quinlivanii]
MRFAGILFLFCSTSVYADLNEKIEQLIEQKLPQATVGIVVKDVVTNEIVYSKNPDKLLAPASSTKLLTAAAALYQLTPEYKFKTQLMTKGNDVYVVFNGSPSLTSKDLSSLLASLPKKIKGNLIIDVSHFKPPYYPGGTSFDDLGWYYAAPDTAAILDANEVAFKFTSSRLLNKRVQIESQKPDNPLHLINEVNTVSAQTEKNHCNMNIEVMPDNTLKLYGCLAQSKDPKVMRLAIPQPVARARKLIEDYLKIHRIALNGHVNTGKAPADAKLISSLESPATEKLITHMLQESDNLYANSFTKELGFVITGEGSYKQGVFAIKQILSKNTSVDVKKIALYDGEGTRYNLLTAQQLVNLLDSLYQNQKLREILFKALPQSGSSGSLKARMTKTDLNHLVYAKTGTLHDASSLSGFLMRPERNPLVFSIIINGVEKPIYIAKGLEEEILLAIYQNPT